MLKEQMGRIVGLIGFAVAAPGFVRVRYRAMLRRTGHVPTLAAALRDQALEYGLRCRAAVGLGKAGLPEAESAVPTLLLAAEDPNPAVSLCAHGALTMLGIPTEESRQRMRQALRDGTSATMPVHEFGDAVLPVLLEGLASSDFRARQHAAEVLARMPSVPEEASDGLARLLRDPVTAVRKAASRARARIGSPAPVVGPALRKAIGWSTAAGVVVLIGYGCSYTPMGRMSYLAALRDLNGARGAPAFVHALNDSSFEVRGIARHALRKLGPVAVPALLAGCADSQEKVRAECADLLGELRRSSVGELTSAAVKQRLNDPSKTLRKAAISSLGHFGSEGVSPLMETLMDGDKEIWESASRALARSAAAAVPALQSALEDANRSRRARAALTLSRIGPPAAASLPALRKCLTDPYAVARLYSAEAVWRIGRDAACVPVLAGFLDGKDAFLRRRAAGVLAEVGPMAEPAVAALGRAASDEDKEVRRAAIKALGTIGPGAAAAVPALCAVVKRDKWPDEKEHETRWAAIDAIGRIGPKGAEAVPDLAALLGPKDARLFAVAAAAGGARAPAG